VDAPHTALAASHAARMPADPVRETACPGGLAMRRALSFSVSLRPRKKASPRKRKGAPDALRGHQHRAPRHVRRFKRPAPDGTKQIIEGLERMAVPGVAIIHGRALGSGHSTNNRSAGGTRFMASALRDRVRQTPTSCRS
jgi:hypothetical protein